MWIADKIYYQGSSAYTRAYQGSELVWDKNLVPLMFTAKANSSSIGLTALSTGQTLEYSTNGSTWNNMTTATTITLVNSGDSVYLRGVLSSDNAYNNYTQFTMAGNIKASGNINYLWNKDNPDTALKQYCGLRLFSGCTALTEVAELELPATTLANDCYFSMFNSCTNLTTVPELPATTLAAYCYMGMFRGCSALTTAPVLPATTLVNHCYEAMFEDCTSLTTAPVLPATTLATGCYREMFWNCTSLITAPVLPVTTLATSCYLGMFAGCESLTTAPELPATALTDSCYWQMFKGCWSLTTAPELPATAATDHCYYEMFNSCVSLTTAPELPATTLADSCYKRMFYGCYNLTTVPELPAPTLVQECYYFMFGNCSKLNYIKCLATSTGATTTQRWVDGVAATGTFVKNPSMTGWTTGTSGIPSGWTVVNDEVTAVTFTAKQANSTIGLSKISTGQTLEYSTDGNTWSNMTTATTISLSSGQSVYIRGMLSSNNTDSNNTQFTMSGDIKASGNINYLWNYQNTNDNLKEYCGYGLFSGITALSDVSELELPATALTTSCYNGMLRGTSITVTPQLPATTLADHCYESMFKGCQHLTTAPALPATVLTTSCYQSLFSECTSLINPPTLPTASLAPSCYREMFNSCTSLVSAPELPATSITTYCYYRMFRYCASLTTVPSILPATTLADSCYYSMFAGCTSLTTAPELPAPTLVQQCYRYMFDGCSNLNYIKCLAISTGSTSSYTTQYWTRNVASTGTFVRASSMSSWTTGNNGIPTNWTVVGPDLTKKHWWTATNGIYNFNLPTRWNNGYRVEVDQYFTGSGNTSSCGSIFRQNSNNSPLEVFYTGGFYFDAHYPNSTTSPTVNTTDYDHRVSLGRTTFNNNVQSNVKYTFKYEMTPTHAIRIYNGSTLVYQTTYNSGNKNWCTTGDYSLYAASMAVRSGWCVVSDIRVYDNNNSLIHNFQLYPSPNPDVLGYEYLDIVTNTWYPVVNGEIIKVETTER